MAAPQQQQQQQQSQPQLQSPAQHGDVQPRGSGVAGPNHPLGSQASLLADASKKRAGHGLHSPTPNQSAASENGQTDPTPTTQATGQAHPVVSNSTMDASTTDGEQSLSPQDSARLAEQWQRNGRPKCPDCKKVHPPPCNPERLAHLAWVRELKDTDPEAYTTEMAAFQAKYPKKTTQMKHNAASSGRTSTQAPALKRKRKEAASEDADRDAPAAQKSRKEKRSKRSRGLHIPWCKSCQEFHRFGKHTKTKQEAQDLLNQQLYGLAPRPQLAVMQAAMDERRMIMTANANRGQLSAQEAQASLDQRVEAQRCREIAFRGQQAPTMFSQLIQQQGPEAGYNFLVGLYNGTVTRFPAHIENSMPAYGYQAQPQYPMLAHGHQAQPQHLMPAYGHPVSAFPTAQQHGLQAAEMHDTAPQPPTGARRK